MEQKLLISWDSCSSQLFGIFLEIDLLGLDLDGLVLEESSSAEDLDLGFILLCSSPIENYES